MRYFLGIHFSAKFVVCFFPRKNETFLSNIQTEVSNRNSPSFVVLL